MRISDWSSDVCSSDLVCILNLTFFFRILCQQESREMILSLPLRISLNSSFPIPDFLLVLLGSVSGLDRKSVVSGKSVSVRVDLGGRSIIKKPRERAIDEHVISR